MAASQRFSTNLVVPAGSSATDVKTNEEITYIFNALRAIAIRIDEVSGALSPEKTSWGAIKPQSSIIGSRMYKVYAKASQAISYGAMVNLYNLTATTCQARYARANSPSTAANAFCNVPAGIASGEFGEFICGPGLNNGVGGLIPGTWYYLSHTSLSGQVQNGPPPAGAGNIYQNCGFAVTDTQLVIGSLNNWFAI
jgi:hypothetical protein